MVIPALDATHTRSEIQTTEEDVFHKDAVEPTKSLVTSTTATNVLPA